jgi:hypothetical protein
MSLTKVSYSMIAGAPFNVLDYGAVRNGSTDDTAAIQAALDACGAAGGGVVYVPSGSYAVTALIIKYNNVRLVGDGVSTRILNSNSPTSLHNPTVWIARNYCGVENIYFSYTTWVDAGYASFLGTRPSGSSYFGNHVCVNFTELYTSASSGVYNTYRGVLLQVIYSPTIKNCTIHGTALHGVALFNCFDADVDGNTFEQFKATGVLAWITPRISVTNNSFTSSGDDAVFISNRTTYTDGVWTPITQAQMQDALVSGNRASKIGAKAYSVCGFVSVNILSNFLNECRSAAIYTQAEASVNATASNKVLVSDNNLTGAFGGYGANADGYYYTTDVHAAVGGDYYALSMNGCGSVNVCDNIVTISTKVAEPNPSYPYYYAGLVGLGGGAIEISGNQFSDLCSYGFVIGDSTLTEVVLFVNNKIIATSVATTGRLLVLNSTLSSTVVKQNIFYHNGAANALWAMIQTDDPSNVILTDNTFVNPNNFNAYRTADGIATSILQNNISTYDLTNRPNSITLNIQNYGSTFPTTGTWRQGDIVWNTASASGGTPGWVCTIAGTPGTWKAMANLA